MTASVADSVTIPPIDLPWPDKSLHPNARIHWAPKAKATKRARETGRMCAYASGIRKFDATELKVTITFFPPDNRRRDLDGMLSNMKAMLDGIADATGVDDCDWSIFMKRGEVRKHGAVRVEMEPI